VATKAKLGQWRVTVAEQVCSLCGACAQWCGPKALTLDQADGGATLRFDTGRCPGCGLCVEACPEKAVTLTEMAAGGECLADSVAVTEAPVLLAASPFSNCVRCGAPSVPTRMLGSLARWNEALGGGAPAGGGSNAASPSAGAPGAPSALGDSSDPSEFATCMACRSDMMFFGGSRHA